MWHANVLGLRYEVLTSASFGIIVVKLQWCIKSNRKNSKVGLIEDLWKVQYAEELKSESKKIIVGLAVISLDT